MNGVDRKNQTGYRPPQIDPIGYLIGDVSRMIRTVYDRRVEPLGLTRAQWRVMTRLNRMKSCTQTELAIALEIEKPTLGKLIERLEAKGWVKRQPDLDDARSKIVCLTPAARPVLEEMQSEAEKVVMAIFAGVSQDDAKRLHRTLNNIKSNRCLNKHVRWRNKYVVYKPTWACSFYAAIRCARSSGRLRWSLLG